MGIALAEVAQRVGGNLHRIQNYAAEYPASQPGPRISRTSACSDSTAILGEKLLERIGII